MAEQYIVTTYDIWRAQHANDFEVDEEFSSLAPAMFAHLDQLNIQTVITERDYIDADYSQAYSHFYSHAFHPPEKSCTRYLFFSKLFKYAREVSNPPISQSFQGFITVWPTDPAVIGRSVLVFPPSKDGRLIPVEAPYRVHVHGTELEITSAMFASKDHAVAVCASIATWLATDLLHRRFDLRTCSSTEMTLLATANDPKWGRVLPQSYGLDPAQMTRALTSLDYGPFIYYFDTAMGGPVVTQNWLGPLYGYLSSGFPVIILCTIGESQHAVLAVGLETGAADEPVQLTSRSTDLDDSEPSNPTAPAAQPPPAGSLGTRSFARTIRKVLVHDDRWGPFTELTPEYDSIMANLKPIGGVSQLITIRVLIVPLPKGMVLLSEHAHAIGISFFTEAIPNYIGPFRTFAQQSVDFKRQTLQWDSQYPASATALRSIPMSKWVWITEAYPEKTQTAADSRPFARIALDSTQLKFAKSHLLIGGHIGDEPLLLPST